MSTQTATATATKPSKFAKAITPTTAPAVAVKETKSTTTLKAEELILIHKSLKELGVDTLMEKAEALKKELAGIIAESGYDKSEIVELKTEVGTITFSACAKKTVVSDKAKMIEALGDELYAKIAEVKVSDLKTYLGQKSLDECTELQYGSRSLKAVTPI